MSARPAVLVVAPHLDDAALGCGALIADRARAGERVVVATVFTGDAAPPFSHFARGFHATCGLTDATAVSQRRAEDHRALALLGAVPVHLGFVDALYRGAPGSRTVEMEADLFSAPCDPALIRAVGERIAEEASLLDVAVLYVPLGLGGHVDHSTVRMAVARLSPRLRAPVVYYEDLPYALDSPGAGSPATRGLRPTLVRASELGWERKLAAIASYTSQVRMLEEDGSDIRRALESYALAVGGGALVERTWS